GTNGYWPSSAEAHITATSPPATTAPTATPLSGVATQNTLMYGIIAIIIVIIIGIAVLAILMARKRP
ncbi:MAG TPA: hypothetical protein VJY36_02935, partial [Candidatus Bathyarchaeia archaeon]|nr:hypothetical protein [Candidatus Bathyarchaeia archaeon]